jgi:hypothetical protein
VLGITELGKADQGGEHKENAAGAVSGVVSVLVETLGDKHAIDVPQHLVQDFMDYVQAKTGLAVTNQACHIVPKETQSSDLAAEEQVNGERQLKLLEKCETLYPRKWDEDMTTAWFTDLGVLLPNEIRRMLRGHFNGKNLIGDTLIKPLTEDDIHKAMGVIQFWTPAEFTAAMTKASIAVDKIPNGFEEDIPDGETLYEQFKEVDSLQTIISDYFQSDELRPLVEKLWAYLTLIDDASRARDARRIFKILTPHLKALRRHQQGLDLVDEATGRNEEVGKEKEGDENRRYGTAKVEEDTHSDSDPETVDDVDGDGEVEDDGTVPRYGATILAGATDGDGGESKTSGTKLAYEGSLDLVTRAFAAVATAGTDDKTDTKDASSADNAMTARASTAAASAVATSEAMQLLPRWIKAYEGSEDEGPDWKTMAVIGKLFTHISETVGQIIIEDKAALALIRSFFPRAMGGIAGGKKFIEKNMLVKVRQATRACRTVWRDGIRIPIERVLGSKYARAHLCRM